MMKQILPIFLLALLGIALAGCESPEKSGEKAVSPNLSKWVGKNVEVQFRRDALGAAAALPISPQTGEINGASTVFYGKLMNVEETGIVIELANNLKWIPYEVILYVGLR